MTISLTIPGAPRTKKNHGWRTKQGKQMPSKAFQKWNKSAQMYLMLWRTTNGEPDLREPITGEINCRALFYRDAERGDAVGYYQALADALEEAHIVENDRLLVSWDGSRMLVDRQNPRVEVTIESIS